LTVSKEEVHKSLLLKRGFITGQISNEVKKLQSFDRVRLIQDEMVKLAKESEWILIDQKIQLDPLDVVALKLDELDERTDNEVLITPTENPSGGSQAS
jgi:2-phosphoglycerate kinase